MNVHKNVASSATVRTTKGTNGIGTLAFVYGVAGRDVLPGVALTRLLGDLGMSEAHVRVLLSRLRRDGELTSTRRGRQADYRLAGQLAARFLRLSAGAGHRRPAWDGAFHALLYQVPERHRAYRDTLRRAGRLQGYGLLQQGVLIAMSDRSENLADVLDRRPAEASVRHARLAFAPEEAARAASVAWDLPALGASYRAHVAALDAAMADAGEPPADAGTLVRLSELTTAPMLDTLGDPGLPPELLPDDWPLPDLWRAIGMAHAVFGTPARAYVQGVVAAAER